MQKIAVYGGTFNPVHQGHAMLIEQMDSVMHFDRILLIPDKIPPHKEADDVISGADRLEMCRLAFADNPKVIVSDMELTRDTESYTYLTLETVREQYPDAALYCLMGADMFLTLDDWKCPDRIYRAATVCTMARDTGEYALISAKKEEFDRRRVASLIFDLPYICISSSELRDRIRKCETTESYLHPAVLQYIREHRLYGLDFTAYKTLLASRLSEARLRHSFAVAAEAKRLAVRCGQDPLEAELAGLLHDICKDEPKEVQLQRIQKSGIISDDIVWQSPALWHSISGALFVRDELGIHNNNILNGIRYHTSGKADMTVFEKIIYLADLTAQGRNYPDIGVMRQLVDTDLDDAMRFALIFIAGDLARRKMPICEDTRQAYQQYVTGTKEGSV